MGRPLKICTDLIPFYVGGSSILGYWKCFSFSFLRIDFSLRNTDMKLPFYI